MKERYRRNIGAVTEAEQEALFNKKVLIVGVGGLGGYLAEYFARLGVGEIRICDFDVFEPTNLNRQINSYEDNLGRNKLETVGGRLHAVNSDVKIVCFPEKFTEESGVKMLDGADVVLDALDNVVSRLALEEAAQKARVPLVFAALSGWEGQVTTVAPGQPVLGKLYKGKNRGAVPVLPFTPAAVSAFQAAEAVKVLLGKPELVGKMLIIDLETSATDIIRL